VLRITGRPLCPTNLIRGVLALTQRSPWVRNPVDQSDLRKAAALSPMNFRFIAVLLGGGLHAIGSKAPPAPRQG
jgi:hypothetical protein